MSPRDKSISLRLRSRFGQNAIKKSRHRSKGKHRTGEKLHSPNVFDSNVEDKRKVQERRKNGELI